MNLLSVFNTENILLLIMITFITYFVNKIIEDGKIKYDYQFQLTSQLREQTALCLKASNTVREVVILMYKEKEYDLKNNIQTKESNFEELEREYYRAHYEFIYHYNLLLLTLKSINQKYYNIKNQIDQCQELGNKVRIFILKDIINQTDFEKLKSQQKKYSNEYRKQSEELRDSISDLLVELSEPISFKRKVKSIFDSKRQK